MFLECGWKMEYLERSKDEKTFPSDHRLLWRSWKHRTGGYACSTILTNIATLSWKYKLNSFSIRCTKPLKVRTWDELLCYDLSSNKVHTRTMTKIKHLKTCFCMLRVLTQVGRGGGSQQDKVEVNTSHCLSATRINTGEMNEQKRIMSKFTSTRMNKVAALIKRQW